MNLKIRQEELDQDYIHLLSDEEKEWLNQFNKEYVLADFRGKPTERLHPKKTITRVTKTSGRKKKVDIFKKDCEDKNNARNRDAYAITKVNNMLKDDANFAVAELINRSTNYQDTENSLIELLDDLSQSSDNTED